MAVWELFLMSVALSMDAAALAMADGMHIRRGRRLRLLLVPVSFGFFQALMPVAGYLFAAPFSSFIEPCADAVVLVVLVCLGVRMLFSARDRTAGVVDVGVPAVLGQAVATSLDGLATGIGLRSAQADIFTAAAVMGSVTALLCGAALWLGRRTGERFGPASRLLGGVMLLALAVKTLAEMVVNFAQDP